MEYNLIARTSKRRIAWIDELNQLIKIIRTGMF